MDFLNNISFFDGLSVAVKAVILLVIALVAAAIARKVVRTLVGKWLSRRNSAEDQIDMSESRNTTVSILGNLTYAVVFLLFLPGVLDALNVSSVSAPLSEMGSKFLGFLPNIIAAILVLVFGIFLAKLLKQILTLVLGKTKLDALQEKVGIKENNGHTFSGIIANLVYVLVLIVFIVAALQILNLKAISDPAMQMVALVFNYVPLVFAALIIVLFGVLIANLVEGLLVSVLAGSGVDERTSNLYPKKADGSVITTTSKLVGIIVKVIIDIFFVVAAIGVLKVDVLSKIGMAVIAYLPNILAALIIIIVAWIAAGKAAEAISKAEGGSTTLALITKIGIIVLAAFMAATQLGIGSRILTIAFIAMVIALAGAFIIAFGVGGRSWAAKKLEDLESKLKK